MSDKDQLKQKMLGVMSRKDYMPQRKRGLARKLKLSDEEYREFRHYLDEWLEDGTIAMLKRGKFGLPRDAEREKREHTVLHQAPEGHVDPVEEQDEDGEEEAERPAPQSRSERPSRAERHEGKSRNKDHKKSRASDDEDGPRPAKVKPPKQIRYEEPAEDRARDDSDNIDHTAQPEVRDVPGYGDANLPDHSKIKAKLPKYARIGRIEMKRAGFGFLLSEPPGDDWFIPAEDLGGAMNGDLVAALPKNTGGHFNRNRQRHHRERKTNGRVIKILERARVQIVGTFYSYKKPQGDGSWTQSAELGMLAAKGRGQDMGGYLVPDARGMFDEIEILPEHTRKAQDGDKVAIELIEPELNARLGGKATGCVVEVFGEAGEARAEVEAVLRNFGLKREFPQAVLDQVEQIPEDISEEELSRRVDYTAPDMPITFTIDPPDAKDHDDAVALRRLPDGRWELLVHIADVSHYCPFGSPLDKEAERRATSVYFPGSVIPMLPQKLSNNLCSLKEGLVRLTKTAVITYSRQMSIDSVRLEKSFIRSAAFLTYDQVKEGVEANDASIVRTPEILETLKEMRSFATALRKKRMEDGSIDLNLPETKLLLDENGKVVGLTKVVHHWAHQLIEDMMLAANRAVAQYMVEHELMGLFRTHPEPDQEDLDRLGEFLEEYEIRIKRPIDRFSLKQVIEKVKNKDFSEAVNMAILTSMKQAVYTAQCLPHFALAFNQYLHFTSPIRRYPDTVVHRALDSRFGIPTQEGAKQPPYAILTKRGKKRAGGDQTPEHYMRMNKMQALAAHCSRREREAAQAEEEVTKVRQIEYLRSNKRDSHQGVITHVRDFGFFVKMLDSQMEGQVRLEDLTDDEYIYTRERHLLQGRENKRSFQLGDKVEVRVTSIDPGRKKVFLMVV